MKYYALSLLFIALLFSCSNQETEVSVLEELDTTNYGFNLLKQYKNEKVLSFIKREIKKEARHFEHARPQVYKKFTEGILYDRLDDFFAHYIEDRCLRLYLIAMKNLEVDAKNYAEELEREAEDEKL